MTRLLQCIFLFFISLALANANPLIGYNISPASPVEFPFIASLGYKSVFGLGIRGHICTGSLITKKHVLTAAHCLVNLTTNEVNVIIGEVDLRTATNESTYDVHSWITYDDWALKRRIVLQFETRDVAIVKLSRAVNQRGVIPVTLSDLNIQQVFRTNGIIAGYGVTNEGRLSDVLLKAKVKILSHEECEKKIELVTNLVRTVHRNGLCSWANPYTLTACGDSGGPLLTEDKILLGVGRASCPNRQWGEFPPEFINQYKFNVAMSIDFCRYFIADVAKINSQSIQTNMEGNSI